MGKKIESNLFEKNQYTLIIAFLFGLLNLFSVKVVHLGTFLSIIEYALIIYELARGKTLSAFLFFLIFDTVSYEMDYFLYLENPPFTRYSFFVLPFVGPFAQIFTIILIYFQTKRKYGRIKPSSDSSYFMRWLLILLIAGVLQGFICILLNDNRTGDSSLYPVVYIIETMKYVALMAFLGAGFLLSEGEYNRKVIIGCSKTLLLSLGLIALISVLIGYEAYTTEVISGNLLAPMASLFIPFSFTFMSYEGIAKGKGINFILFAISILILLVCFVRPNVMGSKWYLVVGASLFVWFSSTIHIKSIRTYFIMVVGAFVLINVLAEPLTALFSNNDYNSWKASQLIDSIDILRYNSFYEWFFSLAPSPAYRIDELLNIGIEYIEKPLYALFGKGFGGTTLHHTPFLNWEKGGGTFSNEQIQLGAYYAMHESLAVIFLRHGILGIVFFIDTIVSLIRKIPYSNWAMLGLIWFFFFWSYCLSFWFGALAIPLCMNILSKNKKSF